MNLETEIKQTRPFRSEVEKSIVNIVYTNNIINLFHHKIVKDYHISTQQYNVLRILKGQKGVPISINGIIERMLDKMSNASRLVDKLFAKGLVDRKQKEDNRRTVDVTITKAGEDLLKRVNEGLEKDFFHQFNINNDELIALNSLLDKFRSQLMNLNK